MPYVPFNNNPNNNRVGDCAVRAISVALGTSWEDAYIGLCAEGLFYHDMPSSNYVWGMYLKSRGFEQKIIPSICPACITVEQFYKDNPEGTFVLATQNHTVTVKDSCYMDSWDSGDEVVLYYFEVEEDSEFLSAVNGKQPEKVWSVLDGLMDELADSNPTLYEKTIDKLLR